MTGAWKIATAAFAVLLIAGPARSGSRNETNPAQPMENYGVIWQNKLTRSGLPDADAGWDWLRAQGVKSIVTFLPPEEAHVDYRKHGFTNVLRIPLDGREAQLPTERQAQRFLEFIQNPKDQPVHIHCFAGRDRTSMMAALARYAVDGWPLNKALDEARSYREGEHLADVYVVWLKDWASKHPPGDARLGHKPSGTSSLDTPSAGRPGKGRG